MSKGSRLSDGERGSATLRMARAERKQGSRMARAERKQEAEWRGLSVSRKPNGAG